jgi:hypothetical protein
LLSVSLIKGIMRETEVGSMCVPQKLPEWIALNRLRGHGCQACAAERRLGAIGGLYNNAANGRYGVPSPNDRKWPVTGIEAIQPSGCSVVHCRKRGLSGSNRGCPSYRRFGSDRRQRPRAAMHFPGAQSFRESGQSTTAASSTNQATNAPRAITGSPRPRAAAANSGS